MLLKQQYDHIIGDENYVDEDRNEKHFRCQILNCICIHWVHGKVQNDTFPVYIHCTCTYNNFHTYRSL